MLSHLYGVAYESKIPADKNAGWRMAFHLEVYQLGDYLRIDTLKERARENFKTWAEKAWWTPPCIHGMGIVYQIAPPGPQGDDLRKVVIDIIVDHASDYFSKKDFEKVVGEHPDMAKDIAKALAGKQTSVTRRAKKGGPLVTCACSNEVCDVVLECNPKDVPEYMYCPVCMTGNYMQAWLYHGARVE
jgi:hypothetical protein